MRLDNEARAKYVAGLRKIADTIEANPELIVPYLGAGVVQCGTVEEIRAFVKAFGGKWAKRSDENDFEMVQELSYGLSLMIFASHENVCQRVVVGTKHIPEIVVPASEERVIPAHEIEQVKWVCPEVLAG